MADNALTNKPDFGFTIDNDDSLGNTKLLDSFLSGENPDVEDLDDEGNPLPKVDPKKKAEEEALKKKQLDEAKKKTDEEEAKKKQAKKDLNSLLNDEEEEEGEEEKEKEEEEEESSPENPYGALSKDLFKLGVFTKAEGEAEVEINSDQEFLDRFNLEARRKANEEIENYISQFGEDYQHAFQAIYANGVNPKEYFTSFNKISNFNELDMSKEEVQVAVIREALVEQGFEAEDIPAEIERYRNYGDLEKVSKNFQKVLIKKEAQKIEQSERESKLRIQEQQNQKQQYVKNVNNVLLEKLKTKEFDGIPVSSELAKEVQQFLLVDKYRTASGENITEFDKVIMELKRPENHSKKVKIALLLKMLDKDPSLKTLATTKVSKESNVLFEQLTGKNKGAKTTKVSTSSAFSNL
jgi:hypothetical protein